MRLSKRLLLLFLTLPLFSLAQSNYKPGYVVTLKGDTLRGYIDYKQWDQNPTKISFKNNLTTNDIKSVSVKDAAAFTVDKLERYQRFVVSVSQDIVDEVRLETKPDTTNITDTVFLRVCTIGKHFALYSYTDKIKERFYYLEAGANTPTELGFHAFYDQEESTTVQYVRRYRTQLENLAQKYKVNDNATLTRIVHADYTEPTLIKIAHDINGASSLAEFTQQSIGGTRWFIGLGANYSQLNFSGSASPFATNKNTNSIFPKFETGFDFFPNKTVQRFSIRLEYSFQVNQFKNITGTVYSNIPATNNLSFTQYNNSLTPQIILNIYNKESFKFFIGAGLSLNMSAYNHDQTTTNFEFSNAPMVQNNFPAFEKLWISLPLRAGVSINKKVELNFCYVPASPMTDYAEFSGSVTSYQFGINYLFGK